MRNRIIVGLLLLAAATGCDKHILSSDEREAHDIAWLTKSKIPNGGTMRVRTGDVRQIMAYNARGEFAGSRCAIRNPQDNRGRTIVVAEIVGSSAQDCNIRGVTASDVPAELEVWNAVSRFRISVLVGPDYPCHSKCGGINKSTYALATD